MDERLVLFNHAGSGNHGCEAIVRGFLAGWGDGGKIRLITNDLDQDAKYLGTDSGLIFQEERHMDRHRLDHVLYYGYRKLTGDGECYLRYRFPMLLGKNTPKLAVSIGGDNYCYPEMVPDLIAADDMLRKRGSTTVLMGCSVEPDDLTKNKEMIRDLKEHRLITARETITRDALLEAGVDAERLKLLPDPAFAMETVRGKLPEGFTEGGTVGINVSPLIEKYRSGDGSVLDAFSGLVKHIIDNTDMQIAFIPHVVWPTSDDRKPLAALMERYKDTGRTVLIGDAPAPVLKGYISRCRFFVGARTHSTIAAYSSRVPTIVAGYSVKSRGIAADIFGDTEGLVLPSASLTEEALADAFDGMTGRETEIKSLLDEKAPELIREAAGNAKVIRECLDS